MGIPPEYFGRIFDPCFTTKETDNGLGLAKVYSIIKKHDGYVEVESELGRGTTFRVWLPAATVIGPVREGRIRQTSRRKPVDACSSWMTRRPICEMMRVVLDRLGYAVTTVLDGSEELKEYERSLKAAAP